MFYIFKFFSIFLCCLYISTKILKHPLLNLFHNFSFCILSTLLSFIAYFLNLHFPETRDIIPLLVLWCYMSIITLCPKLSFISITIAYGISYSFHAISGFLVTIIISPFYYNSINTPYLILSILTSTLHMLLTVMLFRFKRFHKGMPFLFSTAFINIATMICLLFISILIYFKLNRTFFIIQLLTLFLFTITLAFLIHWWQAQITKSYKRSLEQRELESLRIELQEKDKTIAKLKAENVRLGDVTHEYNKLIPPLAEAVCEYLEGDFADAEMTRSKGQALSAQLRTQSEKLAQTTALVNAKKYQQHDSGIDNLNPYLNSFEKQAVSGNIEFSVHTAVNLREQLPKNLSVDDFVHLVVNLLSNAFIAVTDCANPAVQLQFYQVGKHFVIEVSDNGIPFEIESLVNFGLERITTHADTGGSGVGLVAIWEIKEACGATLHIEEYASGVPFSKKISLIFNKKNLYSIRTWRKEEILQKSKRIDLQVYDFEK